MKPYPLLRFVIVAIAVAGGPDPVSTETGAGTFDCRRPGMICESSVPCKISPPENCDCSSLTNRQGYDCKLETTKIGKSPCTSNTGGCLNGGTCFEDAMSTKCYCAEAYYGNTCDLKRFDVDCKMDSMSININPHESFNGKAYISNKQSIPACVFVPVTHASVSGKINVNWKGFAIADLSHTDATCGSTTNVGQNKSREILVQYSSSYTSSLDEVVTFTCDYAGPVVSSVTFTQVSVAKSSLIQAEVSDSFNPVILSLLKGGSPVSGAVEFGDELTALFSIGKDFDALKVLELTADNNLDSGHADYLKLDLIKNSCTDSDVKVIVSQDVGLKTAGNKRELQMKLIVFLFDKSNQLRFEWKLQVCQLSGDTACNPVTCSDGSSQYGRKRRAAGNGDKEFEMSKVIEIQIPQFKKKATKNQYNVTKDCEIGRETVASLVVMGVITVLLLVVDAVFILWNTAWLKRAI